MVAALGTGIVIGAGVAYVYTRLHEHTHLVQQITNLHVSILEVLKKDLTTVQAGKFPVFQQQYYSLCSIIISITLIELRSMVSAVLQKGKIDLTGTYCHLLITSLFQQYVVCKNFVVEDLPLIPKKYTEKGNILLLYHV